MRSSNPVLTRLGGSRPHERAVPQPYVHDGRLTDFQPYQPYQTAPRRMSLDAVVVRTVFLLAVTGITAAASWIAIPDGAAIGAAMLGFSLSGLALAMVIIFARVTNPVPITAYAVIQGGLLGVVSRVFEARYDGIVGQAVIGTFGVFFLMAVLYRARVLRATPKFTRFVVGSLMGILLLSLANLVVAAFGGDLHLIDYGADGEFSWIPVLFALFAIGIGALSFILDFEAVEQGVRTGLPEQYAWQCAFGLLVGLIFLYWYMLRLLGLMRQ